MYPPDDLEDLVHIICTAGNDNIRALVMKIKAGVGGPQIHE
jgi:hypothetical protein